MTSLVPGVVFPTPGLNRKSTPVPPTATPADIEAKYAKAPLNGTPWPRGSPVARVYDVCNTSTKLILYNNERSRVKARPSPSQVRTQLRGQTKYTGCIRTPSPGRHHSPEVPRVNRHHHSRCTISESERFQPRPVSVLSWRDKPILYDNKSPVNPKYHAPCKVSHDSEGLRWERPRPQRRQRSAVSLPDYMVGGAGGESQFSRGEKNYLWSIARIYSVDNLKRLKQDQYLNLLAQEKQKGILKKKDFGRYVQSLLSSRSAASGKHSKAEYQRYMSYLNSPRRTTSADVTRRRVASAPGPHGRGRDKPASPRAARRAQQQAGRTFPRRLEESFSSQTSSASTAQSRGSTLASSRASARSGSLSSQDRRRTPLPDKEPESARSTSTATPTPTPTPTPEAKEAPEEKAEEKKEETPRKEEEPVAKSAPEDSSRSEEGSSVLESKTEESRAKETEAEGAEGKGHQLTLLRQVLPDMPGEAQEDEELDSQTVTNVTDSPKEEAGKSGRDDSKAEHKYAASSVDSGATPREEPEETEDKPKEAKPEETEQEEVTPKASPRPSTPEKHYKEGRDRPKSRIGSRNAKGRHYDSDSDDDYDTDFESDSDDGRPPSRTTAPSQSGSVHETYRKLPSPTEDKAREERARSEVPKGDGSEGYVVFSDSRQGHGERAPEAPPGTETYTKVSGHPAAPSPPQSAQPSDPDRRGDNSGSGSASPQAPPPSPKRKDSIEEGRNERTEVTDVDKIEY